MTRLVGVDAARALALLGMVAAHLLDRRTATGEVDAWFQLVAGRSSALFAVLAGVSLVLASRPRPGGPSVAAHRVRIVVRAAAVAVLGLVLGAYAEGIAVILTYYGVLFLLGVPVLRWRARSLLLLALAWGLVTPALSMLLRPRLPAPTYQVPHPTSLADPWQLLTELLVTGYYPVLTWGTYLFAGMGVARLGLGSTRTARALLLHGTLTAAAALAVHRWVLTLDGVRESLATSLGMPAAPWAQVDRVLREGAYGTTPTDTWWWLGVWSPHTGSWVDLAHTTAFAVAVLAATTLLVEGGGRRVRRVVQVALGAGAMTLTLYAAHVTVVALPPSWGWTRHLGVHLLGLLLVGAVFGWHGRRGPLETGVATLAEAVAPRRAPR